MRLVLFDIDGTLLLAGPAATGSLRQAVMSTYGIGRLPDGYRFGGKTDPQIVIEMAVAAGVDPKTAAAGLAQALDLYLRLLDERLPGDSRPRLLPGVTELLDRLDADPGFAVGLLTGNLEPGARRKLDYFDLNHYFPFGAFGSDSADRSDLPEIALRRAKAYLGRGFQPKDAFIVGDTESDIRIARRSGSVAVAVATGSRDVAYLAEFAPDFLFPDLSDTDRILAALMDGVPEGERRL